MIYDYNIYMKTRIYRFKYPKFLIKININKSYEVY